MERSTILIVDDDELVVSLLIDLLTPLNHRLIRAAGGMQALELAAAHLPDLILLDVMMPEIDGFEVCRRLRAAPALAQIPVVMITALEDREARINGFDAGADDFISKPFDVGELRARIGTVLRLNRYRQLLTEQARVAAERARFEWVVESSESAYLIIDDQDQIRYANARARSYLGLGEQDLPGATLRELAAERYHLAPPEAWQGWPAPGNQQRYLIHPETQRSAELWLQVDITPPAAGDSRIVVALRDVTSQITSQRDMWTFHTALVHKLRTPLVSIIGGLNILHDNSSHIDRAIAHNIAEIALNGARRLQGEIEDILHYLRTPSDAHNLDACTTLDLPSLIAGISSDLGLQTISLSSPTIDPRRLGIARRSLEVVLRELCENAAKFHPSHSPAISIGLDQDAEQLHLTLCDDGVHLPPDQLQQIWQPYYQAEKSFTGQVDGMGLGLALVAQIILAVAGRYRISNRSDRAGVCVELWIPFASDSPDQLRLQ